MSYKSYYTIIPFGGKNTATQCLSEKSNNTQYIFEVEDTKGSNGLGFGAINYNIYYKGELQEIKKNGWSFFPMLTGNAKASMYYENYTNLTLKGINPSGAQEEYLIHSSSSYYPQICELILVEIDTISCYRSINDYKQFKLSDMPHTVFSRIADDLTRINKVVDAIRYAEDTDQYSSQKLKEKTLKDFEKFKENLEMVNLEDYWKK